MSDTHSGTDGPDPHLGTPAGTPQDQPPRAGARWWRRPRLAVLSAVAGVTVVAVGVGLVVANTGSTESGSPPVLRLADTRTLAAEVDASGAPVSALGPHTVVPGSLPDGPDTASVDTFGTGRATGGDVATLARALGLSGTPVHQNGRWQVTADGHLLTVSDTPGWAWSFGPLVRVSPPVRVTPQPPVSSAPPGEVPPVPPPVDTLPVPAPVRTPPTMSCLVIINGKRACPPATPLPRHGGTLAPGDRIPEQPDGTAPDSTTSDSGPAVSPGSAPAADSGSTGAGTRTSHPAVPPSGNPPATPTEDQVRSAARPVLAGLGLSDVPATVRTSPGRGTLTVNPKVAGLPTRGFATVLVTDGSGALVSGHGWLATPRQGTRYPLATAQAVLAAATTGSRCEPCGDPASVTGATPGLLLRRDDRDVPLLVPAWFYRVRGAEEPITLIAVDPDFLGAPRSGPGKHPDVGAAQGSAGNAVAPAPAQPEVGAASPAGPVTRPTG